MPTSTIAIILLALALVVSIGVIVWQRRLLDRQLALFTSERTRADELEMNYSRAIGEIGELQQQRLPIRYRGVVRSLALVAAHIAQDERTSNCALYHADPAAHPEGETSESNYQWRLQQIATAAKVDALTVEQWLAVADAEEK